MVRRRYHRAEEGVSRGRLPHRATAFSLELVVVVVNCRVGPHIIFGWHLVAVVFVCSLSIPVPYSVRDCVRMFVQSPLERGGVGK